MAVIFQDLFEEAAVTPLASHTPDLGTGWTLLYNSAAITVIQVKPLGQSGVPNLCGPSTSENNVTALYGINPSPSTADVKLEADRYMLNWQVSNSYSAGLFARVTYTTDWSGYFVQMVPNLNSGASIRLYKKVLGVTTLLASYDHDFVSGDIVTFECYDAAKRVLVNGVERINHADNTVTGIGFAGLYWGNFVISGHMRAEMEFGYLTVTDASVVGQTIDLDAGSAGGAAAAAGLDGTRDLPAAAAGGATVSATLSTGAEVLLAAQTEGSAGLTAGLAVEKTLAAQPAGANSVAASLQPVRDLAGLTAGLAAVASYLGADWTLAAQIAGTGAASAKLETLGEVTLATSIAGEALLDVDLVATYSLAVQSDGTSTVSATSPALTREIAASVTGTSEVAAGLVAMRDLAVVADGGALVDADLTVLTLVTVDLAGQSAGGSSLSALLTVLQLGAVGDVRTWSEPVTVALLSGTLLTEVVSWGEQPVAATLADSLFADVQTGGQLVTDAIGADEGLA